MAELDSYYKELREVASALKAERDKLREEVTRLRQDRDAWKETAETEAWPFEWEVASHLKDERDATRAEADALREKVMVLRAACENVVSDCKSHGQLGGLSPIWFSIGVVATLCSALDETA